MIFGLRIHLYILHILVIQNWGMPAHDRGERAVGGLGLVWPRSRERGGFQGRKEYHWTLLDLLYRMVLKWHPNMGQAQ
jgi:hypothetical protein